MSGFITIIETILVTMALACLLSVVDPGYEWEELLDETKMAVFMICFWCFARILRVFMEESAK